MATPVYRPQYSFLKPVVTPPLLPTVHTATRVSGPSSQEEGSAPPQYYAYADYVEYKYVDGQVVGIPFTEEVTSQATWPANAPGGRLSIPANAIIGDSRILTLTATFGGKTGSWFVNVIDTSIASGERLQNVEILVDSEELVSGQNPARPYINTIFLAPKTDTPQPPDFYGQVVHEAYDEVFWTPRADRFIVIKEWRHGYGQGDYSTRPFTLHGIEANGTRTLQFTFAPGENGITPPPYDSQKGFVYPFVAAATPFVDYVFTVRGNAKPWWFRPFGDVTVVAPLAEPVIQKYPLGNQMGTNVHPPALLQDTNNANIRDAIPADKRVMAKRMGNLRIYGSSNSTEDGGYSYDRSGFNQDAMVRDLTADGVDFVYCSENLPDAIYNTYPLVPNTPPQENNRGSRERIGVPYGADPLNPASWLPWVKGKLQLIYRWGSNKNIDPALIIAKTGYYFESDPSPDRQHKVLIGMGWMKKYAPWNEWEKYWQGRPSSVEPEEAATAMGVFYPMAKAADPNMEIVFPGFASPTADWLSRYIDACERLHGRDENNKIRLMCDTLEMHLYPSTAGSQYGGGLSVAIAIETSKAEEYIRNFQRVNYRKGNGQPLDIGEIGRDASENSPLRAVVPTGAPYSQREWVGVLAERDALWNAKHGIRITYHYQWEDREILDQYTQFSIMGMVREEGEAPNKVLTAWPNLFLLAQTREVFGGYTHYAQLSANPLVDEWHNQSGGVAYSLHTPDNLNSAGSYVLNLPNGGVRYDNSLNSFTPATANLPAGNATINFTGKIVWVKKTN